jgi:hypothetical protein
MIVRGDVIPIRARADSNRDSARLVYLLGYAPSLSTNAPSQRR